MAFDLDAILAQDTIRGSDRRRILKRAVKTDLPSDLYALYQSVNDSANTALLQNTADAVSAIGNARFPKAWAELTA